MTSLWFGAICQKSLNVTLMMVILPFWCICVESVKFLLTGAISLQENLKFNKRQLQLCVVLRQFRNSFIEIHHKIENRKKKKCKKFEWKY